MGEIRLLPDILINKIAAGEVVERPASVVKELVENALDAGAATVTVTLEEGGRRRVLVEDDGRGMTREDALLALERHATSKLASMDDLDRIRSLGFRGEALPSIAAVSRLVLSTRSAACAAGVRIRVAGGEVEDVRDIGYPRGTAVEVGDLFYNVPARQKFLRTPGTELSHASAAVTRTALAHPAVAFELHHDGRQLLQWPAAGSLRDRLHQVYGEERIAGMLEFDRQRGGGLRVAGLLSPVDPASAKRKKAASLVYVNDRPVSDRKVIQAVRVAYRDLSVTGVNPFYVIFVTLPPEEVDVNVHPTKSEVRFRNPGAVFQAVSGAVRRALQGDEHRPVLGAGDGVAVGEQHRWTGPAAASVVPLPLPEAQRPMLHTGAPGTFAKGGGEAGAVHEPSPRPLVAGEAAGAGRWRLLGQLHNSYLVLEDAEGLLLVDQHVAHERVLYETYRSRLREDGITVQRLLAPEVIETEPATAALLEPLLPGLAELGIELEHFGGSTFLFKGHPDFLELFEVRPFLDEVAEAAREGDRTAGDLAREARQRLLISAACHAAIKINTPLVREKMEQLLADLLKTRNPHYCPHGRPIVLRIPLGGIERSFMRS